MQWYCKALGQVGGDVNGSGSYLTPGKAIRVDACPETLSSENGKLGDSEDSFLYYYCAINAAKENFRFSATLRAETLLALPRNQGGYGLLLSDTDASDSIKARHRNQLFVGHIGKAPQTIVRLVAGYTDPKAEDGRNRVLDQSRSFQGRCSWAETRQAETFSVEKTNEGLYVRYQSEELFIPGCSFLMKQNPEAIYVGIALARGIRLHIENISFETSSGKASETPEGTIQTHLPVYPFSEELLHVQRNEGELIYGDVYVSPTGGAAAKGSREDPMDLHRAVLSAGPGAVITLLEGTYELHAPLLIPRQSVGSAAAPITLKSERRRKAVLSGRSLTEQPVAVIGGDFWKLEGLVFQEGPASGLVICGNRNTVADCEARGNGDTGILIIATSGTDRRKWPAYNQVCGCDSHDNADPTMENADGFGAKLRIGKGNLFFNCMAYRNVDDGFDLYCKSLFGPTQPVEIDTCVAVENGFSQKDGKRVRGLGTGFKLGGEYQAVIHEAWNCLAIHNAGYGFSANSNPACRLHFCTGAGNGMGRKDNFRIPMRLWKYRDSAGEGLLSLPRLPISPEIEMPSRSENGALKWNVAPVVRKSKKKRLGAAPLSEKNVMFLISSLGGGGAERVTVRLANEFSKRHRVVIVYDKEREITYPVDEKVRLYQSPERAKPEPHGKLAKNLSWKWVLFKSCRFILRTMKENNTDTVISMLETPNWKNSLIGGSARRIMSERNDPTGKSLKYYLKDRINFSLSDSVVFQTEKVQHLFSKFIQQKSVVIPNPIEIGTMAAPERSKKIVSVGRLVNQKNHKMLLKAFARFHEKHGEYRLHLYGKGVLQESLIAYADELRIGDAVVFEPFQSDVFSAIADAEMFVLSSDYEGMSNALMEAMAMGIACISTACTGSTDLIEDGVNGLLVPIGDDLALADAMERLAEDEFLRKALEENAALSSAAYSPERISRKWERLL